MEKRIMNSFGNITIPANYRKELGLDGNVALWVGLRELPNGEKEIVIRQSNNAEETLKKYQKWAEVISRITECVVALVWNSKVLSLSTTKITQSFLEKNIPINHSLSLCLKKVNTGGVMLDTSDPVLFLPDGQLPAGQGEVSALFKIENTGEDSCFFVIIKGTKYEGKKISKAEEERRYAIVHDILGKI